MKSKIAILTALTFCLPFSSHAADGVRMAGVIFPPVVIDEGGNKLSGLYYDVMKEIAGRLGEKQELEIYPLQRLNEVGKTEKNVILTVGCNPTRVNDYRWLRAYGNDQMVLVTPKTRKGGAIDTYPKDLRIGVGIGSSMEVAAKAAGFTNLIPIRTEKSAADMLAAGRLDGWVAYHGTAVYTFQQENMKADDFEYSSPLTKAVYFIVASNETPKEVSDKWGKAFDAIVADGTYDKYYQKYASMVSPLGTSDICVSK